MAEITAWGGEWGESADNRGEGGRNVAGWVPGYE